MAMAAADIVTILAGAGAPLAIIGGGVKWIFGRIDKLDARLRAAETKGMKLEREYGRVLMQVQRWRTAFQIVAAELNKRDPGNPSLAIAQGMLTERVPDIDAEDENNERLLYKLEQADAEPEAQPPVQ